MFTIRKIKRMNLEMFQLLQWNPDGVKELAVRWSLESVERELAKHQRNQGLLK
jgi:hypothetical protein